MLAEWTIAMVTCDWLSREITIRNRYCVNPWLGKYLENFSSPWNTLSIHADVDAVTVSLRGFSNHVSFHTISWKWTCEPLVPVRRCCITKTYFGSLCQAWTSLFRLLYLFISKDFFFFPDPITVSPTPHPICSLLIKE